MGSGQSSSNKKNSEGKKYTEDEVTRILNQQRALDNKRIQALVKPYHYAVCIQETARQVKSGRVKPSTSNVNLYPNLNKEVPSSTAVLNSPRSDQNDPNIKYRSRVLVSLTHTNGNLSECVLSSVNTPRIASNETKSNTEVERDDKEKLTKDEVNRMLEEQRALFDKKLKEIVSLNQTTAFVQQTGEEMSGGRGIEKEVEQNRQNIPTSYPHIPPLRSSQPTSIPLEMNSANSFIGQDLKSDFATTPSTYKVPNLCNKTSSSSVQSLLKSDENPFKYGSRVFTSERSYEKSPRITSNEIKSNIEVERFTPSAPPAPAENISSNRKAACTDEQRTKYILNTAVRNDKKRAMLCPNSEDGCILFIKLANIEGHLKECPFRELQCPLAAVFGQCQWRGKLPQMVEHFKDIHQHRQGSVDTEMRLLNITKDKHIVNFVIKRTLIFLFHVKVSEQDGMMYMTVQLMGTQHSAAKWNYEINIYNKSEPCRNYEYTDICNSINTPINDIFTSSKCAAIPLSYANTFIDNNCITYRFFLRQDINCKNNNTPKNNRGR